MKKINSISQFKSGEFLETQKAIQKYASILTEIKSKLLPREKNSEEHSLKIYSKGLTTTPMPVKINEEIKAFEININLENHKVEIILGKENKFIATDLPNVNTFAQKLQIIFNELKIPNLPDYKYLTQQNEISYNYKNAELLWSVISEIYFAFVEFKSLTLKETGNINFWPHHFDLAMLLFTGKLIDGQDESNWSYSREQINFGFLFGDEYIPNPYFYVTFYPFKNKLLENKLSNGAYWYKKDWNGAILELEDILEKPDVKKKIIDFFNEVRNLQSE